MSHQTVIVLDFGGQYNQLIARRVRECSVYCEVKPYTTPLDQTESHGPHRHHLHRRPQQRLCWIPPPTWTRRFSTWGVPILGICYGCQLMAHTLGGQVTAAQDDSAREYGKTADLLRHRLSGSSRACPQEGISWMSHGDYMAKVPDGLCSHGPHRRLPQRGHCRRGRGFYGVQFHPEVNHTAARHRHDPQLPL